MTGRRWRGAEPPWTTQPLVSFPGNTQQHRTYRLPQPRGHIASPPFPPPIPPVIPPYIQTSPGHRTVWLPPRRGRITLPPVPPPPFVPNPAFTDWNRKRGFSIRFWPKPPRGHVWQPPWPQASTPPPPPVTCPILLLIDGRLAVRIAIDLSGGLAIYEWI